MDKETPRLVLFPKLPAEYLRKPEVASAFQSFETSLVLISEGRWTTVLPLIWESCEKLLRVLFTEDADWDDQYKRSNVRSVGLQKRFFESGGVSRALNDKAHKMRIARNEIAHEGYSPRDDERCVELFFGAGVPYFESLVNRLTGMSFRELSFKDEHSGAWFWTVFEDTRKVFNLFLQNDQQQLRAACQYLRHAIDKAFDFGIPDWGLIISRNEFADTLRAHQDLQDLHYQLCQSRRNRIIKELSSPSDQDCVELEEYPCPVCGDELDENGHAAVLAGVTWCGPDYNILDKVNQMSCLSCCTAASGHLLLQVFCKEKLKKPTIEKLQSDKCPIVWESPGIVLSAWDEDFEETW